MRSDVGPSTRKRILRLTPLVLRQRRRHDIIKLRVQHGFQRNHAILHLFVAGFEPTKRFRGIWIVEVPPLPGNVEPPRQPCAQVEAAWSGASEPGLSRMWWIRAPAPQRISLPNMAQSSPARRAQATALRSRWPHRQGCLGEHRRPARPACRSLRRRFRQMWTFVLAFPKALIGGALRARRKVADRQSFLFRRHHRGQTPAFESAIQCRQIVLQNLPILCVHSRHFRFERLE